MQIQLSIEDIVEVFGREKVAKWIEQGMRIEHYYQLRKLIHQQTGSAPGLIRDEEIAVFKVV